MNEAIKAMTAWCFARMHSRSQEDRFLALECLRMTPSREHILNLASLRPSLILVLHSILRRNSDNFNLPSFQTVAKSIPLKINIMLIGQLCLNFIHLLHGLLVRERIRKSKISHLITRIVKLMAELKWKVWWLVVDGLLCIIALRKGVIHFCEKTTPFLGGVVLFFAARW